MYFDSWSELWVMAGHGPFVWFSYAAFFAHHRAFVAFSRPETSIEAAISST